MKTSFDEKKQLDKNYIGAERQSPGFPHEQSEVRKV